MHSIVFTLVRVVTCCCLCETVETTCHRWQLSFVAVVVPFSTRPHTHTHSTTIGTAIGGGSSNYERFWQLTAIFVNIRSFRLSFPKVQVSFRFSSAVIFTIPSNTINFYGNYRYIAILFSTWRRNFRISSIFPWLNLIVQNCSFSFAHHRCCRTLCVCLYESKQNIRWHRVY